MTPNLGQGACQTLKPISALHCAPTNSGVESAPAALWVARSWLYRIATNTAYDYLRRRRRLASIRLTDEHEAASAVETFDEPSQSGLR